MKCFIVFIPLYAKKQYRNAGKSDLLGKKKSLMARENCLAGEKTDGVAQQDAK